MDNPCAIRVQILYFYYIFYTQNFCKRIPKSETFQPAKQNKSPKKLRNYKEKCHRTEILWHYLFGDPYGIRTHSSATPQWGVAATSANTGRYLCFRQRRKCNRIRPPTPEKNPHLSATSVGSFQLSVPYGTLSTPSVREVCLRQVKCLRAWVAHLTSRRA